MDGWTEEEQLKINHVEKKAQVCMLTATEQALDKGKKKTFLIQRI